MSNPQEFSDMPPAELTHEEQMNLQMLDGVILGEPYDSMPFSEKKALYDAGVIKIGSFPNPENGYVKNHETGMKVIKMELVISVTAPVPPTG